MSFVFTSDQGGWTHSDSLERDRPTVGELVESDGRRFKVTYAKDCVFIFDNPKSKTKVGVVWCAPAQELTAVHTRVCETVVMCGAGHYVGTPAVDMLCTECMCV